MNGRMKIRTCGELNVPNLLSHDCILLLSLNRVYVHIAQSDLISFPFKEKV